MANGKKDEVPASVSEYMAKIGARGGKAARGAKKKRPKEHYQHLGELHSKRAKKKAGKFK